MIVNIVKVLGYVKSRLQDGSGNNITSTGGALDVNVSSGNVTLNATDIEIGAVELKNGTDDTRATVTAANALKIDGSSVTQPVSAASLPLPTGAATSAKQPALGTAGTASADVLTVQGIASMTALKVDGSAVTQPVSAASLPLPTGASTSAKQPALGPAGTASADDDRIKGRWFSCNATSKCYLSPFAYSCSNLNKAI